MPTTRRLQVAFKDINPTSLRVTRDRNESAASEALNLNFTQQLPNVSDTNQRQDPLVNGSLMPRPYHPMHEPKQIVASEDSSSSWGNTMIGLSAFIMLG